MKDDSPLAPGLISFWKSYFQDGPQLVEWVETPDDACIFDTEAVVTGSQSDVEHVPFSLHRRHSDRGGTHLGVKSDNEGSLVSGVSTRKKYFYTTFRPPFVSWRWLHVGHCRSPPPPHLWCLLWSWWLANRECPVVPRPTLSGNETVFFSQSE